MRFLLVGIVGLLFAFSVMAAPAQPPAVVAVYGYDASNNLLYICQASQLGTPALTWAIGGQLSSLAVTANVATATFSSAPGLYPGALLNVVGAGSLNGYYPVSTVSGSTVTFSTPAVTSGTYSYAGVQIVSSAPLLTAPVWSIQKFTWSATGLLQTSYWVTLPLSDGIYATQPCTNALLY